jgi:hypothetical protein
VTNALMGRAGTAAFRPATHFEQDSVADGCDRFLSALVDNREVRLRPFDDLRVIKVNPGVLRTVSCACFRRRSIASVLTGWPWCSLRNKRSMPSENRSISSQPWKTRAALEQKAPGKLVLQCAQRTNGLQSS